MPRSCACTLLAVACAGLAFSPAAWTQQLDPPQADLVARGDEYVIHAVPLSPGYVLTHSVPSTGVMKPMFVVRPHSRRPARATDVERPASASAKAPAARAAPGKGGLRRNVRNTPGNETDGFDQRLLGLVADDQRLYVLVGGWTTTPIPGRGADGRESPRKRHMLHVFWLASGRRVHSQELFPRTTGDLSRENAGRGPLELIRDGVTCFGYRWEFQGEAASRYRDASGRELSLPPVNLGERPFRL